MRTMLKSKIHRARVTGADVDYEGSIAIDPVLMDAADIIPFEQVHVLDITDGARLQTYAIEGRRGSGEVVINGAAARMISEDDLVIILAYHTVSEEHARRLRPRLIYVDGANRITRTAHERQAALA
jgi:aspartate 1-decarboxylase